MITMELSIIVLIVFTAVSLLISIINGIITMRNNEILTNILNSMNRNVTSMPE